MEVDISGYAQLVKTSVAIYFNSLSRNVKNVQMAKIDVFETIYRPIYFKVNYGNDDNRGFSR